MMSSSGSVKKRGDVDEGCGFAAISEDLVEKIVGRLPAVSFASAACVNRSWRRVCARLLSRPKLSSALSLHPCHPTALREVVDKVLSEPIRPHFAIVNIGYNFKLDDALYYIGKKLGAQTPVIVSRDSGIIGRDAITNEVKEVIWEGDSAGDEDDVAVINPNSGILLTVGFVPGLKVDVIPLLRLAEEPVMVDKFIMDVEEYSVSVSGCPTPVGVIMFGDARADVRSIVERIDFAWPVEAALVGNERSLFAYRSANDSRNVHGRQDFSIAAVALIFARDRDSTPGSGNIRFHVVLSHGVSAVGPRYKAVSVRVSDQVTWLTARREGEREILDGVGILSEIDAEMENRIEWPDLYVGVTKRRRLAIGAQKAKQVTSLSFHASLEGDVEYLYVAGVGIKTGDCFQFYYSDPKIALASCSEVHASMRSLRLGCDSSCKSSCQFRGSVGNVDKGEVFGGLIFACCGRGPSFFGCPSVDSSPFVDSFPGVPVGGVFCDGEIGRCSGSLNGKGNPKEGSTRQCCHVYSTMYLVMSYTPCVGA